MKDEVIRFVSPVSSNNVFARIVGKEMIKHRMERSAFIRLLAGLDDDIQESLGDNIYKGRGPKPSSSG